MAHPLTLSSWGAASPEFRIGRGEGPIEDLPIVREGVSTGGPQPTSPPAAHALGTVITPVPPPSSSDAQGCTLDSSPGGFCCHGRSHHRSSEKMSSLPNSGLMSSGDPDPLLSAFFQYFRASSSPSSSNDGQAFDVLEVSPLVQTSTDDPDPYIRPETTRTH
ncbi:hypothetical protein PAPYR_11481 [Paratrimastix pyriformis]|uniref:Uncharacterized protein n=1 Tax=Paratrimastix pyriformis TaxID=342808 RepID=A0ABQ8U9A3_9EUKA|nr:hypothetical protein PAPYR_11481 [Paratrimastix pyriformis]